MGHWNQEIHSSEVLEIFIWKGLFLKAIKHFYEIYIIFLKIIFLFEKAVVENIDEGNFDLVDFEFLFSMKEEYACKPLAIKAKLISNYFLNLKFENNFNGKYV